MTRTQRILARDNYQCAYCGGKAIHADHIVPIALRRRHPGFDDDEWMVAACGPCNWRKGALRRFPPSFARFAELPGYKPWKSWNGDPRTL